MIPVLFNSDETLFLSNGLGRLTDAISCIVTEERNGVFEVELVYPVTGVHYDDIQIGRIIYCTHDASKEPQPFDIYKRSAEIDGLVTFYAHHISYRLNTVVSKPFSLENATAAQALQGLKTNAIGNVPFEFYSDKAVLENFALAEPKSIRQVLAGEAGSILDVYGTGEYKFDKFQVWLYVNRGSDRGVSIRYGKNMRTIKAEQSTENRYTAVVPYWANPETGDVTYLPEWAVVSDLLPTDSGYWTDETETIMREESGEPLEFDYQIVEYTPLDLSDQWETEPTEEELRAKAVERLKSSEAWATDENITVSFATDDSETPEELSAVLLCDTVGVYYTALGVEVKTKVIKTVYNTLLDIYDSIELGTATKSLVETIQERTADMMQSYAKREYMSQAIANATSLIAGGTGGHVILKLNDQGKPEEILVMDTDNKDTAVNVIRINKNGIGFSQSGYEGPFVSAWTIDSNFIANFIHSGKISSLDQSTYWDLDNNEFVMSDGTRQVILTNALIKLLLNDVERLRIHPTYWSGDYSGSDNKGSAISVMEAGKYLSLGYYDPDTGFKSCFMIDNGLRRGGRSEPLKIFDSLYTSSRVVCNDEIYSRNGIAVCKTVETGKRWIDNALYMVYDEERGGMLVGSHETQFWYTTDEIIIYSPSGDVTYMGGTVDGDATFTGTVTTESIRPRAEGNALKVGASDARYYQVWSTSFNLNTGVYINYSSANDYIYASKTIHQASDENLKDIIEYDDKYDALVDALEPMLYSWRSNPGKIHVGLGARKTAAILKEVGITNSGFVGVDQDEDGNDVYSVDYQELTVMLLHKFQKENTALKKRVSDLESKLDAIEKHLAEIGG